LILLKNSQFSLKDFQSSIDIHCRHFSILQGRDAFGDGANPRARRESAGSPTALPFPFSFPTGPNSQTTIDDGPKIAKAVRPVRFQRHGAEAFLIDQSLRQLRACGIKLVRSVRRFADQDELGLATALEMRRAACATMAASR